MEHKAPRRFSTEMAVKVDVGSQVQADPESKVTEIYEEDTTTFYPGPLGWSVDVCNYAIYFHVHH